MAKIRINQNLQEWIDARHRHHLSHAQVMMARELGMNPKKLGKLDNHKQEKWKQPLPQFIEHLYEKRFDRTKPAIVLSIEKIAAKQQARKAQKREAKAQRQDGRGPTEDSMSSEVRPEGDTSIPF